MSTRLNGMYEGGDGTHVKVKNFTGDHHGEELFCGSWKSSTDGLTDGHGDLGDSTKLICSLLLDLVPAGDSHDIRKR